MRVFLVSLKTSVFTLLVFTVLFGFFYPVLIWSIGQTFIHKEANGTLFYYQNGQVIGSAWIGQNFTASQYFHPRPSAAGSGYDGANSSGSNLGPTSQSLISTVKQRVSDYRSENNLSSDTPVPADAVTASASGLDPHITLANAKLQAARVASERNRPAEEIELLIKKYTEGWIFGGRWVNVLRLNLALDKISYEEDGQ